MTKRGPLHAQSMTAEHYNIEALMSAMHSLSARRDLPRSRWVVAISLGSLALLACWIAQARVEGYVQKAHLPKIIGQPRIAPPAVVNWGNWGLSPHPRRVIHIRIRVAGSGNSIQINTIYDLLLRPNDPLAAAVRRGQAAQNPYLFLAGLEGSVNILPSTFSLHDYYRNGACILCGEIGQLSAPAIQQMNPSSNLVVISNFNESGSSSNQTVQLFISRPLLRNSRPYLPRNTKWVINFSSRGWLIVGIRGAVPLRQTESQLKAEIPASSDGASIFIERVQSPLSPTAVQPSSLNTNNSSSDGSPTANGHFHLTGYSGQPNAPVALIFIVLIAAFIVGIRTLARQGSSARAAYVLALIAFVTLALNVAEALTLTIPLPQFVYPPLRYAPVLWWTLLPLIVVVGILLNRPDTTRKSVPLWAMLIPASAALGVIAVFAITHLTIGNAILVSGTAIAAVALPTVAIAALGSRKLIVSGAVAGALIYSTAVGARLRDQFWVSGSWWLVGGLILLGSLWGLALAVAARDIVGARRPAWWAVYTAVGVFLFLPVISLLNSQDLSAFQTWPFIFDTHRTFPLVLNYVATDALATFITLGLVVLLRDLGGTATAESNPLAKTAAVFLVAATVSPIVSWAKVSLTDVVASIAAIFTFSCLLPKAHVTRAVRLASFSKEVHTRLMRRQVRERIMQRSQRDLRRAARRGLTIRQFDKRWHRLGLDRSPNVPRSGTSSRVLRLATTGSGAGFSPWQNGCFGALAALALCSPIIIFELYAFHDSARALALAQITSVIRHSLRWVAYGLVYGYFYPRIPGTGPIRKALLLLLAILPPELLLLLSRQELPTANLGVAALLKIGEVIVFTIGLGLSWEARLSYAAGLPWSMVRDFRSLGSLGTPITALLVAATTAVATVLAGAATTALLHAQVPSGKPPTATSGHAKQISVPGLPASPSPP